MAGMACWQSSSLVQRRLAGSLRSCQRAGASADGRAHLAPPRRDSLPQRLRHTSCVCRSLPRVDQLPDVALLKDRRVITSAVVGLVAGFLIAALIFGKPWHLPPNWGDIPTWLAVVVATAGGWIALSQLRGQQVVLRQDAEDRRRAQAARIFVGAKRDPGRRVYPYVVNASDFSIYEAQLWYLSTDGQSVIDSNGEYLGTILPGEDPYAKRDFTSKEARSRTILTFRDANSVRWIRMPGGVLDEQSAASPGEEVSARLPVPPPGTQRRVA